MNKKQRKIFLLISLIFQMPMIGFFFSVTLQSDDLTRLIPIESRIIDILMLFLFSPLLMIFIIQFLSTMLSISFFKFHNIIKFRKFDYAILSKTEENLNIKEYLIRAFLLGFFAFSVSTIVVELVEKQIIISGAETTLLFYVIVMTFFPLPILSLITTPIWVLLDSGAVCARKKKKEGRQKIPDIEGVYKDYLSFINGYIGISTIVALILLIHREIIAIGSELGFLPFIFIAPFVSTAISMPPLLFYDWKVKSLHNKFVSKLTKRGLRIVDNVNDI